MKTYTKVRAIGNVLQQAKGGADLDALLCDLLTDSEIDKIFERVQIFECLHSGLSQRETSKKTTAAIATVTRGAQVLKQETSNIAEIIKRNHQQSWWRQLFWGL